MPPGAPSPPPRPALPAREAAGNGQTGAAAIRTAGLTRRFGDLVAVDAVFLEVVPGEIFGLVGPNGAGKSTMIKMLTTLLPPTAGEARVAGFDVVAGAARVRRRIGYVPQLLSADGSLTGYENLLLSARLYGIPRKDRDRRIQDALSLVGLADAGGQVVRTYSGGMIRRLEIAQSMLHAPAVLFMDEPTVGLDPVARRAIWEHIREVRQMFGTTILITTHMMDEAEELCDRVVVMHQGAVVALGSPAELKSRVGPNATMDDVFAHFSGAKIESGGSFREILRIRRTARRLS
jgi:ABC-2 type transport system ATP-binding protein